MNRHEQFNSEAAWLAPRQKGIGASEAAAVLGLSPYESAFGVWAARVGLRDADPEKQAMKQGSGSSPS